MGAKVSQADLRPCDVLLMQGRGLVPDLIRLFDQGRYNHAAIYDGQNVMEVLSQGTSVGTLDQSSVATPPVPRFVDVYRFLGSSGKPLGSAGLEVAPCPTTPPAPSTTTTSAKRC